MKRYHVTTFGCQMNVHDSERIKGLLESLGLGEAPSQDEADVVAMCNNSPFGLASYFYSRDLGRVWRVAEALESGMVGVNTGLITTEVAPFGGVKESGLGREGSHHGMEEYVEIKYVMMAGV